MPFVRININEKTWNAIKAQAALNGQKVQVFAGRVLQDFAVAHRKKSTASIEKIKREIKILFLLVAGFTRKETEKMNLMEMSDEEFRNIVRHGLFSAAVKGASGGG
jgi:hypothetical protein